MRGLIQLQCHIQEDTEEQAHPETLSAMCRSAWTLHSSHWLGYDLEDGNSISRRQTDTHTHTHDGIPYKWLNYVQRLSSIIRACHIAAERIICGNDPYNAAHTQLKIMSETWGYKERHMSQTLTYNLTTPSLLEHSKRCSLVAPTMGGCNILYAAIWQIWHT